MQITVRWLSPDVNIKAIKSAAFNLADEWMNDLWILNQYIKKYLFFELS